MKILIDDRILSYSPEQIAQWIEELPQWRREQVLAMKHDSGRRQRLLVYRLLCQGLREEYGIAEPPTFVYGEHGKPSLSSGLPHFSLAHCQTAVACIIDTQPCGIDIESMGRGVKESVVRYAMNEAEQQLIAHAIAEGGPEAGERSFLRLWTQKEAVLKLTGTGIRDNMKDTLTDCLYKLNTYEKEGYTYSVATSPSKT